MSRDNYLPNSLSSIHSKYNSAYIADILVSIVVVVGILYFDVVEAIKLSSFFVLLYYSITNYSVIKIEESKRLYPVISAYFGLFGCLLLASSLFINLIK